MLLEDVPRNGDEAGNGMSGLLFYQCCDLLGAMVHVKLSIVEVLSEGLI